MCRGRYQVTALWIQTVVKLTTELWQRPAIKIDNWYDMLLVRGEWGGEYKIANKNEFVWEFWMNVLGVALFWMGKVYLPYNGTKDV